MDAITNTTNTTGKRKYTHTKSYDVWGYDGKGNKVSEKGIKTMHGVKKITAIMGMLGFKNIRIVKPGGKIVKTINLV